MCVDTAADDEESDYSVDLVCAEEVTASTHQEEDKTGSCSDLLLASSPGSSLPSEESSIDEPDSSLRSEESAIIDSSSEKSVSDSS